MLDERLASGSCPKRKAGNFMSALSTVLRSGSRLLFGILLAASYSSGFALDKFPQESATSNKAKPAPAVQTVPRGKKLVLKDGTFQVVREYNRTGERVRYYSLERGDWEELPASMVDWDATAKAAGEDEKVSAAQVEKVHKQEEAKRMDNVADIDASLQVGAGLFLPDGEGMFVVEGKQMRILTQVSSQIKADKLRTLAQIVSPVPIVPGKLHLTLAGTHSVVRVNSKRPEFYLREPPEDPERVSKIQKSAKPGDAGPDVELIRAKVTRNGRELESITTLLGQEMSRASNTVSIQRWEVAPSVYRFTLSEALPPGEYVLAQIVPDGLDVFVWEFGVDAPAGAAAK
jgi:hypothetical protein